ncbi:MAG: glycosyltransferase family 2 protein [Muribaculaceae bacterium]|jgi:glycosyltransferase involved in cell wall biosynthesis|nr:glycosyltransferase family 2 protein [Muribaculaceae bacterium]
MDRTRPVIALVVPCYNEQEVLPSTAATLGKLLDTMLAEELISDKSFVMFVNDGSHDNTWQIITALHAGDKRFKALSLAHNRGQQAAMLAGLMTVREMSDAAITIDADMQDSPDAAIEMVRKFKDGADIVYGVRASRASDSWFKRSSARAFYSMQQHMGLETIYDHSEFRLMGRKSLDILAQYGESNLYLRGIMTNIGLRTDIVTYDRAPRTAGVTKYTIGKLLTVSIDGITSFTAQPMRLIFSVGSFLLIADIIVAIWVLVSHFQGRAISGWSSLMLSIWFLGSLVLIALGIIGEYIGKIYVEVKHRPRYNISEKLID